MQRTLSIIASKKFFVATLVFFALQAAWIALSARYPMAFDEDYHFGIIRLYADHISPFWSGQPAGADAFGAVYRDPSYLYHWLMSFPYRLIALFTDSQAIQVLFLRFINIALLASCLPLYRRLLLRLGLTPAQAHSALLLFVLIPVVPVLGGQINYDNLLMPLVAGLLLLTIRFSSELRRYKRVNVWLLGWLFVACLLAGLVKVAFLPVLLAIMLFVVWELYSQLRLGRKLLLSLGFGLSLITRTQRWVLVALLVISFGLFTERYGVNLVRYHNPAPACDKVLSIEQCDSYGPWQRDHYLEAVKAANFAPSILKYDVDWFGGMWVRLFFAVDGPSTHFQTRGPLILPGLMAIALLCLGLVCATVKFRRLVSRLSPALMFCIGAALLYVAILWTQEYLAYARTGKAVAINGRYLLPVLPILAVPLVIATSLVVRSNKLKAGLAVASFVLFLWGGGALTYILRSNDAWYWPNHTVRSVNHAVQHVLTPIVPGSKDPTKFLYLT
jgi:hypothetical protein